MFKDKNLLVISHSYANFIKDQVETISKYFNQIYVLVRYNPLAEYSNFFYFFNYQSFMKKYKIDLYRKPKNITIIVTPITYLPLDIFYKKVGISHYSSVYAAIKKYNVKFDLIHSHFIWSSGYVGALLKQKYNKPLIITGHGYDLYDLPFRNKLWRENIISVLSNADHIITVSNKNKEILESLNINSPITVITNGYKEEKFHPMNKQLCKSQLNIPINKKILLTIGDLVEIKGHKYLIDALRLLKRNRTDFICYIIGEGELKGSLKKQIQDNDLNDNIKLMGWINHKEISLWMNSADLFILPSLNEGNPTVMFECLGCGLPFIGTNVGGIPEIINSNSFGFLVPPKNSIDLKNAIIKGLEKNWEKNKIISYGNQFRWNILVEKIINVYDKYLY